MSEPIVTQVGRFYISKNFVVRPSAGALAMPRVSLDCCDNGCYTLDCETKRVDTPPPPDARPIAYTLSGHDNDTHMYVFRRDVPPPPACSACGLWTDMFAINPLYTTKQTTGARHPHKAEADADLAYTYDLRPIVTTRFREFCRAQGITGLQFDSLPADDSHFQLRPLNQIRFDPVRKKTRFGPPCMSCGAFRSVTRATPAYLHSTAIDTGIYRTDLAFGSGNARTPLIVVGLITKLALEQSGLVGLMFRPAYASHAG